MCCFDRCLFPNPVSIDSDFLETSGHAVSNQARPVRIETTSSFSARTSPSSESPRLAKTPITLTGFGDAVRLPAAGSNAGDLFPVLRVNPSIGRAFLAEEDQPGRDAVVLLSDKIWRGRFGADSTILGKTITLDGVGHKVTRHPALPVSISLPSAELWLPLAVRNDMHNISFRPALGRLRPGVAERQALAELDTFVSRRPIEPGERKSEMAVTEILPLKRSAGGQYPQIVTGFRRRRHVRAADRVCECGQSLLIGAPRANRRCPCAPR